MFQAQRWKLKMLGICHRYQSILLEPIKSVKHAKVPKVRSMQRCQIFQNKQADNETLLVEKIENYLLLQQGY